jgi:hypothetical protein
METSGVFVLRAVHLKRLEIQNFHRSFAVNSILSPTATVPDELCQLAATNTKTDENTGLAHELSHISPDRSCSACQPQATKPERKTEKSSVL